MAPSHWRLILNGKSTDNEDLREAVGVLRKRGIQLDVRVTWEEGDAERYVAEAIADGVQTVVAAGGDGTLSEVAAALAHHQDDAATLPSLGLVPLGTANDFATAAMIPLEPARRPGPDCRTRGRAHRPAAYRRRPRPALVRQCGQRRLRHAGHRGNR